jgi:hypothetical protein
MATIVWTPRLLAEARIRRLATARQRVTGCSRQDALGQVMDLDPEKRQAEARRFLRRGYQMYADREAWAERKRGMYRALRALGRCTKCTKKSRLAICQDCRATETRQ